MANCLQKSHTFFEEKKGNVAVMGALAMLPVMLAVGLSAEYSEVYRYGSNMQNAVDAATLHVAKEYTDTNDADAAKESGIKFFYANCRGNYCSEISNPDFEIVANESVTGTASGEFGASFAKLANVDEWKVNKKAKVAISAKYQEYHFVGERRLLFAVPTDGSFAAKTLAYASTTFRALH